MKKYFYIARVMASALTLGVIAQAPAFAQDSAYPARPIRLIVSQQAGGSSDTIARLWAEHAGKAINGSIVVENKPGAGGIIAAQQALSQPADGYTLMFGGVSQMVLNRFTYKPLPYDPEKDFTGVGMLTTVPFVLVANPDTGFKSLGDLVNYAKTHPDKLNFASAGLGNSTQLAVELLQKKLGISMVHVPFKGEPDGVMATIGGQTQVMAPVVGTALAHIKAKKVIPLVVLAPRRLAELPDVPVANELGVKDFDYMGWSGIVAKTGTPATIVNKLNEATRAFHNSPEVQEKLKAMVVIPMAGPASQVMEVTKRDTAAWGPTLDSLNLSNK
ncbi:Bug family tripartite tricarboxylate transporter substrate binding protein [Diaphorobacter aerolatus]|uniref:Tripartite tricarboxylate transporter substrate binding protein n=1 Tax=Diaphorobacter aerolatus TaxID=1288495 RepID=A0A7H0GLS8_9BURK|nr:tripartite tricarboxylate transporter substrate binding protein [Diaphorobacter aerolatus]QNP49244.1 tripartite tricarboxylate transporter substrate binding protein [Diaphorobacter aerolatus]